MGWSLAFSFLFFSSLGAGFFSLCGYVMALFFLFLNHEFFLEKDRMTAK